MKGCKGNFGRDRSIPNLSGGSRIHLSILIKLYTYTKLILYDYTLIKLNDIKMKKITFCHRIRGSELLHMPFYWPQCARK